MELEQEAAQRLVLAKTMGLEADKLPTDLDPYKHVFLFRININHTSQEEIGGYMEAVIDVLGKKDDLRCRGILSYFIPVRDVPTSLSIVNLETMLVGKL